MSEAKQSDSTAELGLWEVYFSPRRYSLTVRNWIIRRRNPAWHGGYELMLTRCADTRRYATEKAAQKVADIANAMQPNTTNEPPAGSASITELG